MILRLVYVDFGFHINFTKNIAVPLSLRVKGRSYELGVPRKSWRQKKEKCAESVVFSRGSASKGPSARQLLQFRCMTTHSACTLMLTILLIVWIWRVYFACKLIAVYNLKAYLRCTRKPLQCVYNTHWTDTALIGWWVRWASADNDAVFSVISLSWQEFV